MESSRGLNKFAKSTRQITLPPKCPFQWTPPPNAVEAECNLNPTKENVHHQRMPSDSILLEEQPAWLDELLNEPEVPVYGGHRRSSSDPAAYFDIATESFGKEELNHSSFTAGPSWKSQNNVHPADLWHFPLHTKTFSLDKHKNRACDSFLIYSNDLQMPELPCAPWELGALPSKITAKPYLEGAEGSSARNDCSDDKHSASRTDAKRIKQQIAHRSRVKRLQYIADLERNVQILQAEGAQVSAQLEYFDEQNLLLGMENRALKQRLDSLSHEQLIKHFEQNMLEREIGRLQFLLQQQRQQQQQHQLQQKRQKKQRHSGHRRSNSADLVSQVANLSV
ncbi:hypothetical protein SLA2020_001410 [Shorea laevis]